jgi:hypothetical protein
MATPGTTYNPMDSPTLIFNGITNRNPVVVVVPDDPESVLITLSHSNFITLIINVCQIMNVIIGHAEDISDLNDTSLVKHNGQLMVGQKLKNILNDVIQGQLAISSCENHCWNCPFLVVTRKVSQM